MCYCRFETSRYHLPLRPEQSQAAAYSVQGGGGQRHQTGGLSDPSGDFIEVFPLHIFSSFSANATT